jgi:hypothetical protein
MKEETNDCSEKKMCMVKKMYTAVVVTALVVLLLCAGVYWLFLRNGGEKGSGDNADKEMICDQSGAEGEELYTDEEDICSDERDEACSDSNGEDACSDGEDACSDERGETCSSEGEDAYSDEEEVCVEEDDSPVSQFMRIMEAGESVWRHDDFVGNRQWVTFIYFYPTSAGGGRMSYIFFNDDLSEYYVDHSYSGSYAIQGADITSTMRCFLQGRPEELMFFSISEKNGSLCLYRQGEKQLYFHHIDTTHKDPYREYSKR